MGYSNTYAPTQHQLNKNERGRENGSRSRRGTLTKQSSTADVRVLGELIIRVRRDDILIRLVVFDHNELCHVRHPLQITVEVRRHIGLAQFQLIVGEIFKTALFCGTIGKKRRIQYDKPRMRPTLLDAVYEDTDLECSM